MELIAPLPGQRSRKAEKALREAEMDMFMSFKKTTGL